MILPMRMTLFKFSASFKRLSWFGIHQHQRSMFSAAPAFEIAERVSSSIFPLTGALAAHATKAKYLKNVLNSSRVVESIDNFFSCSSTDLILKTSVIPKNYYKVVNISDKLYCGQLYFQPKHTQLIIFLNKNEQLSRGLWYFPSKKNGELSKKWTQFY